MELYVLNKYREQIGIIDDYTSLIWAKRYNDIGDCEVYVIATPENLSLLKRGNYLIRSDDDMVCRIKKVQLQTDVENGDYLIVTGYDAKDILNQRIIWNTLTFSGKVEDYIMRIIKDAFNMDVTQQTQRKISYFKIKNRTRNLNDGISEQTRFDNVGEKVQALCKTYGYGSKVFLESKTLYFDLYKGQDKSDMVVFSPEYDNLLSTNYSEDSTNIKNTALVGGIGEGKDQVTNISGHLAGIDRYEMYIDASSISNSITYKELIASYPDGYIDIISPTYIAYRLDSLDVILVDNIQFNELMDIYVNGRICYKKDDGTYFYINKDGGSLDDIKETYPNQIILYQIYDVIAANLVTATIDPETQQVIPPQSNDNVTIANVIYDDYLLNKGYEEIAKYGVVTAFEGSIEAGTTFKYKEDYDIGDIVKVENEYGIVSKARIVEIVEVFDDNGYSIEPKFEFMEVK